ncbi:hypothetical protein [Ralstonia solanacearum]|uniref:hypothetical protein n=1 Tax=Ralstonia solanacearum TaxID=305 RepID=UPI0012D49184|nr:hypothetical protein [Ralstonia solanacearum]MDC6175843.1 hypothetical protein [Ralstonia solanacearum]MDC6208897.1 hypothetical protein [Ralstonia solanacearum]MDC6239238.1 hypothetical protein [Ralstonia solanacearum]MDD7801087.1 hypothetical protein [Ralstonia solanacearum]
MPDILHTATDLFYISLILAYFCFPAMAGVFACAGWICWRKRNKLIYRRLGICLGIVFSFYTVKVVDFRLEPIRAERARVETQRQLGAGVSSGDLATSESCLFSCSNSSEMLGADPSRVMTMAADRVIREYAPNSVSPHQQALLFAAYKEKADVLKNDPAASEAYLHQLREVVRIGESAALWEYVRKTYSEGNHLPVNDSYFSKSADNTIRELLIHQLKSRDMQNNAISSSEGCDMRALERFIELSRQWLADTLCEQAREDVRRSEKADSAPPIAKE